MRSERLQRAAAAVGRGAAADGDHHLARAGVDGGSDQLAGAATRGRRPRRARRRAGATAPRPGPARRPRRGRRRGSRTPPPTSRPERIGRRRAQDPAAARPHHRLHRALAAVGDRQQRRPPPRRPPASPRPIAAPPLRRVERALELVGRDEDRPGHGSDDGQRLLERLPRVVTVDREHDRSSPLPASRWRRTSSTSIRAASSSGKPPTPVPNATSASDRAPSSSAVASVAAVARRMMSADVGPPSSIVAAWITQRDGQVPGRRGDRLAQPDRREAVALLLDRRAARARDRAGHAAAVGQPRVGRVRDRVHLELRDVGFADLDLRHAHRGAVVRSCAMSQEHATPAEEEYLQIIYWLMEAELPITGANIARAMQLSPPTVHEMVGRLEQDGYVTRDEDKSLRFTDRRPRAGRGDRRPPPADRAVPDRRRRHRLGRRARGGGEARARDVARVRAVDDQRGRRREDLPARPPDRARQAGPGRAARRRRGRARDVEVLRFENEAEDLLHYLKHVGDAPGPEGQARRVERRRGRAAGRTATRVSVTRSVAETVSVSADPSPPPRTALPEQLVLGKDRYGR